MSITFRLEIDDPSEALNLSNGNAAALLVLAGLPSAPSGEVRREQLATVITTLLRTLNSESSRAPALTPAAVDSRWSEGSRTDDYLTRRTAELLALLVLARTNCCGVTWG